MKVLKRTLYLQALVWFLGGAGMVTVPRFLLVTLLSQSPYPDYVWARLAGLEAIVISLTIVLVAHRIERLWWWSWAYAVLAGVTAAIVTLHALLGIPDGAASWPWWIFAAATWVFAFFLIWGLSRAGQERPIV